MVLPADQLPFYGIFIIYSILFFIGTGLLLWRRNKEPIKSRGIGLLLLQTTAGFLSYLITAAGPLSVGCFVFLLRNPLFALWTFPYVFRGLVLWFRFILQHALRSIQFARKRYSSHTGEMTSETERQSEPTKQAVEMQQGASNNPRSSVYSSSSAPPPSEEGPKKLRPWEIRLAIGLQKNKWIFTWKYDVLVFGALTLIYGFVTVVRYFVEPFVHEEEERRDPSLDLSDRCDLVRSVLSLSMTLIVILIGVMIVSILLWSAKDSYHVKHELLAVFISTLFLFIPWVAATFGFQAGNLDRFFWAVVTATVYLIISVWMPVIASFTFEKRLKKSAARDEGAGKTVIGPEVIQEILVHPLLKANFAEYLLPPSSLCLSFFSPFR